MQQKYVKKILKIQFVTMILFYYFEIKKEKY